MSWVCVGRWGKVWDIKLIMGERKSGNQMKTGYWLSATNGTWALFPFWIDSPNIWESAEGSVSHCGDIFGVHYMDAYVFFWSRIAVRVLIEILDIQTGIVWFVGTKDTLNAGAIRLSFSYHHLPFFTISAYVFLQIVKHYVDIHIYFFVRPS